MATATQSLDRDLDLSFKHILMSTDFSEGSNRALPYAIGLARQYGSELFLAHAAPALYEAIPLEPLPKELDRWRREAEREMDGLVEAAGINDIRYSYLIEKGPITYVLCRFVELKDIDLLVLGTHGRGGLKKFMLGSVAEEVLRLVSCPVLTVGPNVAPRTTDELSFKRILFATDFGLGADKALPVALALAQKYGAKFILQHLVTPMPIVNPGPAAFGGPTYYSDEVTEWEASQKQKSVRKLLELVPSGTRLALTPEYMVSPNSAPEGILGAAATHDADLIVMGAHRAASPHAAAHLPWSVVHRVICEARCPVLTVRG